MGTHMWSSSQSSRRGRRMSLELPAHLGGPAPIPMNAKDSEFLQRNRPELFPPYLPTPFSLPPPLPPAHTPPATSGAPTSSLLHNGLLRAAEVSLAKR